MAFISKADIIKVINEDELNEITRNDDAVIEHAISTAIQEMKSHLYNWYDTDTIFDKAGDERDKLLVRFAVDIAIYELVGLGQAGQDFEDREKRYKRAISWIKAASKPVDHRDRIHPDLPKRDSTITSMIDSRSRPKRGNYYE